MGVRALPPSLPQASENGCIPRPGIWPCCVTGAGTGAGTGSGTGTGLGLAIVAAIAQAHGGTAHAANRPQGGADVWLSLPAP
ncbi:MAG: hypothetical protein C4299_03130 [Thermoleophilia bacterium]